MLFGLAPALQVTRLQANEALKEGGRGATTGAGLRRLRGALVAGEVAMSLVLLAGAGLMMRTIQKIGNEHPGFNAEKVTAARVILPRSRYGEPRLQAAFFQQLLEKLRATPGVEAAGAISHLPLSGQESRTGIAIEGAEPSSTEPTRAHHRVVTTGYFETMRIPLIEGRLINESDAAESTPVMLVNQTMARKYWPGQSPVGRRVLLGGTEVWREVVGVVGDVKHWGMDKPVNAEMYLPEAQTPWGFLNLVVRSGSNEAGVAAMLREKMREIDKNQPAPVVRTMEAVMAESNSARRFLMLLLGLFAGVAMTLASVGIYGVMSYMVSQRTHEIGIRMALGAQREDIFRLIVGHGMGLTLAGVVVGLAGAFWLSRFLADQVFGVTPKDPLTLVGVAVLLTGVALAACLVPARRAASVEPMRALRYE
jgi:predicted permease